MKTIGISDKEKQLLFIVLSLGILVAAYFLGFVKLMDKARAIEASNEQDQATVNQLQGMVDKQYETEQETLGYKNTIRTVIAKYPIDVPQEKTIYQVQEAEDLIGFHVDTINFSMKNMLMEFSGDNSPTGYYNSLGIHFTSSYDQFKELLKHIRDYSDRCTSPSISMEYDQVTGMLAGTITYRTYYLTQSDSEFDSRKYEDVPPTGITSGVDSIFGTLIEIEDEETGETSIGRYVFPIPEEELENQPVD
ncbi:MAG: hypothetical protein IKS85_06435 [Lachnospiraceae bacterium]|nr:hypothetical protein [Lachnospiraceae bacterium]